MKAEDMYVGQRVRFRDWDDMKAEFGVRNSGAIDCRFLFTEAMKELCGQEFTIVSIDPMDKSKISEPKFYGVLRYWKISSDMIKPVFDTVQISGDLEDDIL